ncbi:hypothetical protein L2E82_05144 [Cichorium intybus]|uniref:Uncharacterized protein n=1 Tax=Cichorium intybus TaxID=13427 RepID=A0ACB9H777_CICIN|nr:hypothetical protein L2E82_05144 [Cichorium intybus]
MTVGQDQVVRNTTRERKRDDLLGFLFHWKFGVKSMIEIRIYHNIDSEIRIASGADGVKKPHRYRPEQLQCENQKVPEHRVFNHETSDPNT